MTDQASAPMIEDRLHGFLDDAAIFPPGDLPVEEAVRAHLLHRVGRDAALLGPFVLAPADLGIVGDLTSALEPGTFRIAVTARSPEAAADAIAHAGEFASLHVAAVEVALPAELAADQVVPTLVRTLGAEPAVTVYVELPRDERRSAVVAALATTPYLAKLRTGGPTAEHHPDEEELAQVLVSLVRAGVAFKATAGLHHAVRCTDAATGFEQHGFLNLLLATDAVVRHADVIEVQMILADRDPARVATRAHHLSPQARLWFRSIGTCSIAEPVSDLIDLGLLSTGVSTPLSGEPS